MTLDFSNLGQTKKKDPNARFLPSDHNSRGRDGGGSLFSDLIKRLLSTGQFGSQTNPLGAGFAKNSAGLSATDVARQQLTAFFKDAVGRRNDSGPPFKPAKTATSVRAASGSQVQSRGKRNIFVIPKNGKRPGGNPTIAASKPQAAGLNIVV